jgi:hypothetical protein
MKLVRVKRYIPKWNDNRKQPKESQGWVEYNPSHPVEEIDRVRGLEDLSPLEAASHGRDLRERAAWGVVDVERRRADFRRLLHEPPPILLGDRAVAEPMSVHLGR